MKRLRVTEASGQREVLLVGKRVVGRNPACAISSSDILLSRKHAEFSVMPDGSGVMVRDLSSVNGIRVNDVPTQEAVLVPGDVVSIAGLRLEYVDVDEASTQARAKPRTAPIPVAAEKKAPERANRVAPVPVQPPPEEDE